jgi:hypothetical protein
MAHGEKALPEGVKVTCEAITGRTRGRGIFGIEEEGNEGRAAGEVTADGGL